MISICNHSLQMAAANTDVNIEEFICVQVNEVNNPDFSKDMVIDKNKKIFDIRKSGKRLWIRCDSVSVKYPFAPNQYKTDAREGTFVIYADSAITSMIKLVDDVVKNEFMRLYKGEILNNIMMTPGTIDKMYRSSLYKDTMKICISPTNCAIFDKNHTLIVEPDIKSYIRSDMHLGIVLEPAFAWMFNQKIGIHWDARQVKVKARDFTNFYDGKFQGSPYKGSFKNILADSDDDDDVNVVVTPPLNIKYEKMDSLLDSSDDDDDDEDNEKEKITEVKKVTKSTKAKVAKSTKSTKPPPLHDKMANLLDSSSDDEDIQEISEKTSKIDLH